MKKFFNNLKNKATELVVRAKTTIERTRKLKAMSIPA